MPFPDAPTSHIDGLLYGLYLEVIVDVTRHGDNSQRDDALKVKERQART
jgi:hypothetical protein